MGTFDAGLIRDNIRTETGYWFALPSFIGGMARVIDLFGVCNRYRYADSEGEADSNAIRRDFEAVGRDIRAAMATK